MVRLACGVSYCCCCCIAHEVNYFLGFFFVGFSTHHLDTTQHHPPAERNFRFYASAIQHDETSAYAMDHALNYATRNAIGVCGLITPWNLPLYLLSWKVAPALAMGNSVVAKPSELTPRTAAVLAEIIHEAGVPPGVFNLVHGLGGEVGNAIVSHEHIRCVSFTGGTATGKIVASVAAPMFKKLSLELGGKNSCVVFESADFDKAVAGAVRSSFTNQGQVCLANSRIFVQRPIYDRFVGEFVGRVVAMRVGDPSLPDTSLGPVSSLAHREKVESYIQKAKDLGGTILAGGDRPLLPGKLADGAFLNPTVIGGLSPRSAPSCEEIFGPVVTVHPFDEEVRRQGRRRVCVWWVGNRSQGGFFTVSCTLCLWLQDEVIALVNATRYGLAGSIWTRDLDQAHRVAGKIDSGVLWGACLCLHPRVVVDDADTLLLALCSELLAAPPPHHAVWRHEGQRRRPGRRPPFFGVLQRVQERVRDVGPQVWAQVTTLR